MDHKSSKKTTDHTVIRMHQLLKKWKRFVALAPAKANPTSSNSARKFLKKTLSFSDNNYASSVTASVPKGCVAVRVGEQMKKYVVPTVCLSHAAFVALLEKAEEEFGFAQEGVLRIPCDVSVFELVLQIVMGKKNGSIGSTVYCTVEADGVCDQHQRQKSV